MSQFGICCEACPPPGLAYLLRAWCVPQDTSHTQASQTCTGLTRLLRMRFKCGMMGTSGQTSWKLSCPCAAIGVSFAAPGICCEVCLLPPLANLLSAAYALQDIPCKQAPADLHRLTLLLLISLPSPDAGKWASTLGAPATSCRPYARSP